MDRISIVIPLYNEQDNLKPLYDRLTKSLKGLTYELIFVNDGSFDNSLPILNELQKNDSSIKIITHDKNLGHEEANFTGLNYASGDAAILIDADLQDPPELIPHFIDIWKSGYDLVYGIRANRRYESTVRALLGYIYYFILKYLTASRVPFNVGDFCLIDKSVLDTLKDSRRERVLFRSEVHSIVCKKQGVVYQRSGRYSGRSKYSIIDLIKLGAKSILNNMKMVELPG